MAQDLSHLDCIAQAELVRRGKAKPIELVEAAIERAEQVDSRLGAIVSAQFERARAEAGGAGPPAGPFRGVPYLLKDLGAHLDDDPVYCGMGVLRDAGWREQGETHFAGKLRSAGMICLGRTSSPELGLLPTTEPDAFGPTNNPWKPTHSPGGSSGGSAAAVAAGIVAAAHASDGGGSIRIPASHCGLVGLKPSRGRNSFGPGIGERWAGCSAEGFVTRSVRDSAALLDVTAGPMPGDPYFAPPPQHPFAQVLEAAPGRLRIGLMRRAPRQSPLHPDCREAVGAAAALLESLGHDVEEAHPPALDDPAALESYIAVVSSSVARALDAWGQKIGREIVEQDVEPLTWVLARVGRERPAPDYIAAVERNHAHGRSLASWWEEGFDLLLTPTCAEPPPLLGSFAAPPDDPLAGYLRAEPFGAFTMQFNISGQPAISLPLHWNEEGLPIGIQLVAAYGREDLLIRVASQLEKAEPWRARLPPLHASRLQRGRV
jgi:amidase